MIPSNLAQLGDSLCDVEVILRGNPKEIVIEKIKQDYHKNLQGQPVQLMSDRNIRETIGILQQRSEIQTKQQLASGVYLEVAGQTYFLNKPLTTIGFEPYRFIRRRYIDLNLQPYGKNLKKNAPLLILLYYQENYYIIDYSNFPQLLLNDKPTKIAALHHGVKISFASLPNLELRFFTHMKLNREEQVGKGKRKKSQRWDLAKNVEALEQIIDVISQVTPKLLQASQRSQNFFMNILQVFRLYTSILPLSRVALYLIQEDRAIQLQLDEKNASDQQSQIPMSFIREIIRDNVVKVLDSGMELSLNSRDIIEAIGAPIWIWEKIATLPFDIQSSDEIVSHIKEIIPLSKQAEIIEDEQHWRIKDQQQEYIIEADTNELCVSQRKIVAVLYGDNTKLNGTPLNNQSITIFEYLAKNICHSWQHADLKQHCQEFQEQITEADKVQSCMVAPNHIFIDNIDNTAHAKLEQREIPDTLRNKLRQQNLELSPICELDLAQDNQGWYLQDQGNNRCFYLGLEEDAIRVYQTDTGRCHNVAKAILNGYTIVNFFQKSQFLSGDFSVLTGDYNATGHRLYGIVGDAKGHSIASALMATEVASSFKALAKQQLPLQDIVKECNGIIYNGHRRDHLGNSHCMTPAVAFCHEITTQYISELPERLDVSMPASRIIERSLLHLSIAGGYAIIGKWLADEKRYILIDPRKEDATQATQYKTSLFHLQQDITELERYIEQEKQSLQQKDNAQSYQRIAEYLQKLQQLRDIEVQYQQHSESHQQSSYALGLVPCDEFAAFATITDFATEDFLIVYTDGIIERIHGEQDFDIFHFVHQWLQNNGEQNLVHLQQNLRDKLGSHPKDDQSLLFLKQINNSYHYYPAISCNSSAWHRGDSDNISQ